MTRLTLDIDDDTHRRLRIQAATTELTMAAIGRALIRDYLDADEGRQEQIHVLARSIQDAP